MAAGGRDRAQRLGVAGVDHGRVIEIQDAAARGDRRRIADAVHEALVGIAALELQGPLVDGDARRPGDRPCLTVDPEIAAVDRGGARVGVGAGEIGGLRTHLGKAASAADATVEIETVTPAVDGRQRELVATVGHVAVDVEIVVVVVRTADVDLRRVVEPGLGRCERDVGIEGERLVRQAREQVDAARTDRETIGVGIELQQVVDVVVERQASDGHVGPQRRSVG